MEQWKKETKKWIVYLMYKGNHRYVGITSKSMPDRLERHKKTALKPETNTLVHNTMNRVGLANWNMKKLATLRGTYHEARELERSYMYLSNLNETLRFVGEW